MKTTFDLPDDLIRELKLRAVHDRRKLKDVAADLLRRGLKSSAHRQPKLGYTIVKDKISGLPVIQPTHSPKHPPNLTPDDIHRILSDEEAAWYRGNA